MDTQKIDPKVERIKEKITKGGADAVIILMKKYNLSLFDEAMKAAMIECFQQGAMQGLDAAQEVYSTPVPHIDDNPDEIPF